MVRNKHKWDRESGINSFDFQPSKVNTLQADLKAKNSFEIQPYYHN